MPELPNLDSTQTTQEPSQPLEPPAGPVTAEPPAKLRFGSDASVPDELKGKTSEEVADLFARIKAALPNISPSNPYSSATPNGPQARQEPPPPQMTASTMNEPDPDLMLSDPREYQRQFAGWLQAQNAVAMQQALAPAQPLIQGVATMSRNASTGGKYKDIWSKWGTEVDAQVAPIPIEMRTVDVYDRAAELVRSTHFDDLLAERMAGGQTVSTTESSTASAPPASGGDALDQFWSSGGDRVQWYQKQGLSKDAIRQHCRTQNKSLADWVDAAQKQVSFRAYEEANPMDSTV